MSDIERVDNNGWTEVGAYWVNLATGQIVAMAEPDDTDQGDEP